MVQTKRVGSHFENRVKQYYIQDGFFVSRTAGSRFPDLIAIKPGMILFIECKVRKEYFRKSERMELLKLAKEYRITPVLAYREKNKVKIELV